MTEAHASAEHEEPRPGAANGPLTGSRSHLVVASVTDSVHPYHLGGKETRTRQLLSGLASRGVEVHVYTMNWWQGPRHVVREGVHYHAVCRAYPLYHGARRSILEAVMFALGSLRVLGRRFDVIEADQMPYLQLFPLRVVSWLRRVPLLVTWHELWGAEYWREYLGPLGTVASWVESLSLLLPDRVVAPSPETASRLVAQGMSPARVQVVANGIDVAAIEAAAPASVASDVVYVGRLMAHKNVDLLLEALAMLRDRGRTASCAVVGSGPERDRLEQLARSLRIEQQCRFLADLDAHELYSLMKAARVVALPSVREGFGIVLVEAIACGVPVITTNHPDNHARALVEEGKNGWLCEPSAASLAAVLEQALRRRLPLDAARREVLARYDWRLRAAELQELIEDVVAANRGAP